MNDLIALGLACGLCLCAHYFKRRCDQRSVTCQSRGDYGQALALEDQGLAVVCTAYFCSGALMGCVAAGWWLS
jgi:hypothetical protein